MLDKKVTAFHRFVLEGNEPALEEFYHKARQSPVLGGEAFRERVMKKPVRVDREHPRHERAALRPSVDKVLRALAKIYGVRVESLLRGKRGDENEARKVGMYLLKELCDLRLQEIAERFGAGSYGTVGWACHGVAAKMEADPTFRERIIRIRQSCQESDLIPFSFLSERR